jgi:hypothetical protein
LENHSLIISTQSARNYGELVRTNVEREEEYAQAKKEPDLARASVSISQPERTQ